jgi:pyrroloquinoline quinone (PQQ) biosynthesis protein C
MESGTMMKRIAMLLTLIALTTAAALMAYEEFRVIGRVMQVESSSLKVRTKEGKEVSIATGKQTAYLRDQKKADASEVQAGLSVVVDAKGDSYDNLVASEVRIVLGPAKGK